MTPLDEALRCLIREEVAAALEEWQPPARPLTYSPSEVAALVGVSVDTIYRELHAGGLRPLAIDSKSYRIPAVELDRWIAERSTGPTLKAAS